MNAGHYDIAIVGGGPAGAVAGMVAARLGARTIVLEAATEPVWKPGEVLAPECNPILRELGLWSLLAARPDMAIPSAGVRSVWGGEAVYVRDGFREPHGAGWIVDRPAFETALSEQAIAAGAEWIAGARVISAERRNGTWRIAKVGTGEPILQARVVIDATGRPARLARKLGARRVRHQPQIVTVAHWRAAPSRAPWLDIESVPDGWWYSVATPGGMRVLAWFGDRATGRSYEAMHEAFAATRFLKTIFSLPSATEPVRAAIMTAESAALDRCAGEGWLAVGDAAAAFDPIASQGLSNALASGNAAARAAVRCSRGNPEAVQTYDAEMAAAYAFYLAGVRGHYRSERRWPDQPFWRTRVSR